MNTLQIKIPTHFGLRKLNFKAPDNFNALTKAQLLKVVRLIFSDAPDIDKKIAATKHLYGLKWWHLFLFTPAQMAYMNTFCSWLFDGDHRLTENKIDKISTGLFKKNLYGPMGDFETLKGSEWTDADSAYMSFLETTEEENLDNLIAILWRPRNKAINPKSESFKKDIRIPYNPHTVERRAKQVSKIDSSIKYAILLWYRGCRMDWEDMFEKVFKGGTKEQVENYGWTETIQKVSGKLFGNLNDTEDTYMYKILLNMQIEIKDHDYWKSKNQNK